MECYLCTQIELTFATQIPFGSYLVPRIMSRLPIRMSKQTRISLSGDKHSVNEGRLHAQIGASPTLAECPTRSS